MRLFPIITAILIVKNKNLAEITVASVLGISQKQITSLVDTTKLYHSHNSNFSRDVVTLADIQVHNAILSFANSKGVNVVSEESKDKNKNIFQEYLILDPLDGSQNYFNNIPAYGTLTSYISDNKPLASGVCSHTLGVSIFTRFNSNNFSEIIFSRKPNFKKPNQSSPLLLAYGPNLEKDSVESLSNILFCENEVFPGFHRIGSMAHAFIQFCLGSYGSFLALNVRPWDIYPILHISSLIEDVELLVNEENFLNCFIYYKNLSYPNDFIDKISKSFNLTNATKDDLILPFPS